MFDGTPYGEDLVRRIATARRMLDVADPLVPPPSGSPNISREVRGLVILLLFASYENLLTSICRGLLEEASRSRVSTKRLRAGFKRFAIHSILKSLPGSTEATIWKEKGKNLVDCLNSSKRCTIDVNVFPKDGSFMKASQVRLFFEIFDLGDPGRILKEIWGRLDTIVTQRNRIAHGQETPEEIGRGYSSMEIRELVDNWEHRWKDVIAHIQNRAGATDFYRAR